MPNGEETRHSEMEEKELDRKLKEKEEELERRTKEVEDMKKEAEAEKLRKEKEREDKKEKDRAKKEKIKNLQSQIGEVLDVSTETAVATEEAVITEEAAATLPRSSKKRKRKDGEKRKARKEIPGESSDEEDHRKFTLQAKTKIPTLEKGMTYAKYKTNVDMWKIAMKGHMSKKDMGMALLQALPNEDNRGGLKDQAWKKLRGEKLASKEGVANLLKTDFVRCIDLNDKHAAIKYQDGWSIDKYIAEAQQIWDQMEELSCPVSAPMKCATLIRGLNLTGTQVHLIASKLTIGADDLEDQTIDAIKAFADTNRILTKASNLGRVKEEENVNLTEDALGYEVRDDLEGVENALFVHGACNYCKKKGHFKRDCPANKERMEKIRKFKEAKGETWMPPDKYAEFKKAQREAEEQDKAKDKNKQKAPSTNYLAQCTCTAAETTRLFNANQLDEESEYDSYITIATFEKGLKDNGQGTEITGKGMTDNIHIDKQKEGTPRAGITKTSPVQIKTPVQADDPLHLHRHYEGEDTKKIHTKFQMNHRVMKISKKVLILEQLKNTSI